jgi:preprotein translocase subunit SecY
MFSTLANVFRIPELRNKLLFTLAMLVVYRIGYYIPLPGVDGTALKQQMLAQKGAIGTLAEYLSVFSGGSLGQSTIFGLGIMPYISASIILQLLSTVLPSLEKLKKEGEPGMRKINEWTRYLTVLICLIQGGWWISTLMGMHFDNKVPIVYTYITDSHRLLFILLGTIGLTAGSCFLMWLGEQIDHYGIGNGISLIITAGIVSRMPETILKVAENTHLQIAGNPVGKYGPGMIAFLVITFVCVVAGSIFLTQAQRRIRIQQAKHMRGRKVYGGGSQYLPLRVNHAGVMPIIFASSLMIFPPMLTNWISRSWPNSVTSYIDISFGMGGFLYVMLYIAMIFFFAYFWNTVQFNPKEISTQLRDYGSFIPGLRPGKRTADYLENVMFRITYVGSGFLCVIAVLPTIIAAKIMPNDPNAYMITQFLGGTGLLIVISVMLDLVNRIEANLVMRDYGGFLESGGGSGAKNKSPKSSGSPGASRTPGVPKGIPS